MIKFVSGRHSMCDSEYIAHGVVRTRGRGSALVGPENFFQVARSQNTSAVYPCNSPGWRIFSLYRPARIDRAYLHRTSQTCCLRLFAFSEQGTKEAYRRVNTESERVIAKDRSRSGQLDWDTETKPLLLKHLEDGETIFYVYEDFNNE